MSGYKRPTTEKRPNAELAAAMLGRTQAYGNGAEDVTDVIRRTHPESLLALVGTAPPIELEAPKMPPEVPKTVSIEVVSNVISLAAKREDQAAAQALAEQTEILSEQDTRIADARKILEEIGHVAA